nr:hypothetical protein [Fodinicola acaciae]
MPDRPRTSGPGATFVSCDQRFPQLWSGQPFLAADVQWYAFGVEDDRNNVRVAGEAAGGFGADGQALVRARHTQAVAEHLPGDRHRQVRPLGALDRQLPGISHEIQDVGKRVTVTLGS